MRAAMTRPLALIAALLSVSASAVYAADSCGGGCPKLPKTSRSVSATIPALPTTSSSPAILSAGLAKGKPKRVLHVEATITSGPIGWASASTLFMVAGLHPAAGPLRDPFRSLDPVHVGCCPGVEFGRGLLA